MQFVSRRFEGLALQYFHRMATSGRYADIEDYGSYWCDDSIAKTNGEFDCVIKRTGELFDFYECNYFDRPMTLRECEEGEKQLRNIQKIKIARIGFVCRGGFDFGDRQKNILIDGQSLYQETE